MSHSTGTSRAPLQSWLATDGRFATSQRSLLTTQSKDYGTCSTATGPDLATAPTMPRRLKSTESLRSIPGRRRVKIARRVSSWRGKETRSEETTHSRTDEAANESTEDHIAIRPTSRAFTSDIDAFISDLDALCLTETDLDLLKRMRQVHNAGTIAQERRSRSNLRQTYQNSAAARQQIDTHNHEDNFYLHLRGGASDNGSGPTQSRHRRRTTLPPPPARTSLLDSARPKTMLWWLAGGRVSRKGKVPTMGELRVRKEVEVENRRQVGFWGTVPGIRKVGSVGILDEGAAGPGEGPAMAEDAGSLTNGVVEGADGDDAADAGKGGGSGAARAASLEGGGSVRSGGGAKADGPVNGEAGPTAATNENDADGAKSDASLKDAALGGAKRDLGSSDGGSEQHAKHADGDKHTNTHGDEPGSGSLEGSEDGKAAGDGGENADTLQDNEKLGSENIAKSDEGVTGETGTKEDNTDKGSSKDETASGHQPGANDGNSHDGAAPKPGANEHSNEDRTCTSAKDPEDDAASKHDDVPTSAETPKGDDAQKNSDARNGKVP